MFIADLVVEETRVRGVPGQGVVGLLEGEMKDERTKELLMASSGYFMFERRNFVIDVFLQFSPP